MKTLKFDGESYTCCAPRYIHGSDNQYTCDAWKAKTGRVVMNARVLNGLALALIRGKGGGVRDVRQRTNP